MNGSGKITYRFCFLLYRFFFLSNDELLEILSETKDPTRVQPHLRKCFEGIDRLEFGEEEDIRAMVSVEKERVAFRSPIYPAASKGLVEKWLAQVESAMVTGLKSIIADAVARPQDQSLIEWILQWPGQVAICAHCVRWTAEITRALSQSGKKPIRAFYQDHLTRSAAQLDEMADTLRRPQDPGVRITLGALVVVEVHARDVVAQLAKENVQDTSDFAWAGQLRYYWSPEGDGGMVMVKMVATDIEYGFEYLGNTSRLVMTPLTDRCYRALLGAVRLHLGGAPEGPAGTGKTETVKDLAKAVAKQCVVFNCSEGLDHRAMGKFFKGLAQSGAWACFDEFNRIDTEVLSVVSQQIQQVQLAKARGLAEFAFEGTQLTLNPSCAIFVTMNPGYAERHRLPDNLQVAFRTVAMVVPDYETIGEISLLSCGFLDARRLSSKVVYAYRLCSEQLSQQRHYDYGMRAIKAVLVTAGNLKALQPEESEEALVLKALRDVNRPKFLAQDAILFEGILSDLFTKSQSTSTDHAALRSILAEVLSEKNLQATPSLLDKISQMHDTMQVRHGVMLVGGPLSGKTTAYLVLAEALGRLKTSGESVKVTYRVINPKAVAPGKLYGSFDPVSREWTDGVVARAFRELSIGGASDERRWIILDGPVDAAWIESMNTVLDDNRKLCLTNGEIIPMSSKMSLVFETSDLEHASPATVSRCGMVYMEPEQLGWRVLKDSYLDVLPSEVERVQRKMVSDMFDWLVPHTLDFIRNHSTTFVCTNDMHLVASTIRFYDILLKAVWSSTEGDSGASALQSQQVGILGNDGCTTV